MNSIVKNTLILTGITLISGLLLGTAYEVTKGPIAAEQERTKQEAYASVLKDASTFEEGKDIDLSNEKEILMTAGLEKQDVTEVVIAKNDAGEKIGYVFLVTSHEGYGGDIELSVGMTEDGTVTGVEILSISETAGLGMRANTKEFKEQFQNKKVDQFIYTKTGKTADNEIDALSGATITSNAMTNGVNAAIAYFDSLEGGNGNE